MKNDSFLFPFGVTGDSMFDSDNDGQLTGIETAFRDAVIMTALDYLLEDDTNNKDNDDDYYNE